MASTSFRSCLLACVASVAVCAVAAAWTQTPGASDADGAERARLMGLHREAVTLLTQASRAGAPLDDVRRALGMPAGVSRRWASSPMRA